MSDRSSHDEPQARRPLLPPWVNAVGRVVITAALLAYALRGVKWHDHEIDGQFREGMWSVLTKADWSWWLAGMATAVLVQVVAGIRWAELARPLGFDFPRRLFVWRFFEGMFFSLCLPSSIGGDVVKAYRIGDTTPRRLLAGCSVLADRLTGLSALAVLGGAALAARKYDLSLSVTLAVAAGLLTLVLGAFLLAVSFLSVWSSRSPSGSRSCRSWLWRRSCRSASAASAFVKTPRPSSSPNRACRSIGPWAWRSSGGSASSRSA